MNPFMPPLSELLHTTGWTVIYSEGQLPSYLSLVWPGTFVSILIII